MSVAKSAVAAGSTWGVCAQKHLDKVFLDGRGDCRRVLEPAAAESVDNAGKLSIHACTTRVRTNLGLRVRPFLWRAAARLAGASAGISSAIEGRHSPTGHSQRCASAVRPC
jgi:hypothetical protein